jgi:hypothetical protein
MPVIEIQTIEGGRLEWVAIYSDSDPERAIRWGDRLVGGMVRPARPNIRILNRLHGEVIGAWQQEGYEPRPTER